MIVFPLSLSAKILLILIAVFLGMIWSMIQWPEFWKKRFREGSKSKLLKGLEKIEQKKSEKKGG